MSASWVLDRRVPLAFVGAIFIQTFSALVWAGAASERIAHAEAQVGRVQELSERAARLEEQTIAMRTALERIESKLDRLAARPH